MLLRDVILNLLAEENYEIRIVDAGVHLLHLLGLVFLVIILAADVVNDTLGSGSRAVFHDRLVTELMHLSKLALIMHEKREINILIKKLS